ncbi:DUF2141 domain-containing protein [Massilia sp. TSP1-1-2]|uniref:DUF2141 domain-containing protein n=1 Tax=unclassified Massilia TaxID=2609279 RepID=UPI003CFAB4ED
MHTLIKTAFLVTSLATGLAGAADLTIQVDDVKAATGSVLVAVFNSEGTFLKAAAKSGGAPATLNGTTVVIGDLPEGDYAFAVYHDANANGKMDRNLLGIPTEDYGFSNNALGKMGPPSYASARFVLPAAGASLRVSLK